MTTRETKFEAVTQRPAANARAEKHAVASVSRKPIVMRDPGFPAPEGLYDPAHEKDSCGVGFVADIKNRKTHKIVEHGLKILDNLDHRGACRRGSEGWRWLRHAGADSASLFP